MSDNQNAPSEKTPQQGPRRLITLLFEVCLLVVLGVVVYSNRTAIMTFFRPHDKTSGERRIVAEPSGDKNAEREAAAKLGAFKDKAGRQKYLVIIEKFDTDNPDKRVTCINYKGAKLDDETLELTSHLYRIGTVIAGDTDITDDQLKYFAGLTALTSLVLTNTSITDAGLQHLRPLANLETLHLSGTKISDRGLNDIAHLTTLKILNLSDTKVTDAGLKDLLPLTDVEWLLLANTDITDAGLATLADMKKLRHLTIGHTKTTPAGIERLKKALPAAAID